MQRIQKKVADFFSTKKVDRRITHNHHFFGDFQRDIPLEECEFVVIDSELTGLNIKKDEIVALGAVRIKNLQIVCSETFYGLVKPSGKLYTESTLVHQITPQELSVSENLTVVLPHFLDFCGDAYFVGHYVRLDLQYINRAAKKIFGGILKTPYLDTMRLAMAFNEMKHGHYYDHYNIQSNYNLTALTREFNLPRFTAHNALEDAFQAAYLFLYLAKQLQSYQLKTLDDFFKAGRNWKIII